ncbi:transposase [Mariniphaga sp.]|uniref:transposase n=1 Tax=Mariniphaga sp. TaxID=1954475 RepID=UPI0035641636
MGNKIRKVRQFSTDFKKEKVKQIDDGKITVLQLSRIYEVSSTAIYKWIRKYSRYAGQNERVVIQKESEQTKTFWLLKKVSELEQLVGQKQVEIEYLKKVIDFGSEITEKDIKKKFESRS